MILTGENRNIRRETYPSASLSTTNPAWTSLGVNVGLRDEKQATNRLSYGWAQNVFTEAQHRYFFDKTTKTFFQTVVENSRIYF
jgi:hypothetical protein